jgi:hypothetical protein
MPDTPSITINKTMTYRGQPEVTSNTYHFSGTTPGNDSEWHTLALAIWNEEAKLAPPTVKFCGYLGYAAGNEHAVSIKNYNEDGTTKLPGTYSGTDGAAISPGDVAIWVRWTTPDRTSRGKRIYLRKYFHEVPFADDTPAAAWRTAAAAYGAKMIDGTLPGGFKVCGPQGAVASVPFVAPYMTTRTLKRRGRRPSR